MGIVKNTSSNQINQ